VRVLERRASTTLVAIEIASGRPHQIRIHLAHAGLPLVGEPFFGTGGRPRPGTEARPGDCGYLLHAERLCFRDPFADPGTAREMDVECAPPSKLRTREEEESP
jgi:23S rRNA pseudouridine1911/1915/1917 synthase